MRSTRLFVLSWLAFLGIAATPARGTEEVLTTVPNQTPISAYGAHVVWSELDRSTKLWYLVDWHDGRAVRLPVAPRKTQFDVDVGPDARGRPTAVYSRCRREPLPAFALSPTPDWMTARGCDLYALPLTGEKERLLGGVSTRRGSETTPSLWRGALAFARRSPGRPKARIYLRPVRGRLVRLAGGTLPRCKPARLCPPRPDAGIDALDLGPRSVAFLWRLTNGNVFGSGVAWELRSDPLTGARGVIDSSGYVGECEIYAPQSPNAFGRGALFLERLGGCAVTRARIASLELPTGAFRQAQPSGLAYALARDGATLYWIRGPRPQPNQPPDIDACATAANACVLVRTSDLHFHRARHRKQAPPLV